MSARDTPLFNSVSDSPDCSPLDAIPELSASKQTREPSVFSNPIAMSSSWWQARDSNTWEWQSSDWTAQSWKQSAWDNKSSSTPSTTQCPTPTFPASFVSDTYHYDKTPVGKGCHVLHRCVQATEWSRKNGLAGRDVADIRAHELSHRGFADFSFRLLSEGRHQSIVWARSGSESVLLTALLKKIRESEFPLTKPLRHATRQQCQTSTKKQ